MENPATTAPSTVDQEIAASDVVNRDPASGVEGSAAIEAELLIEEISIDGMCGVY